MADLEEEEDVQRLHLKHSLLIGLKTTVEGLLAAHTSNVWSTYGGLPRLCKDVEKILNHRLKFVVEDYGSVSDFWSFVKGLKWLNPVMTPFIERIRKGQHKAGVSKGQVWVRESLREHNLSTQLKVLVNNSQHLHSYYFEDAFLQSVRYFHAMCICLQAVEENRVALLADIDPKLLNFKFTESSLIRSASMPVNQISMMFHQTPHKHRSSQSDPMALAPPFASPSRDGDLTLSGEHGVPHNIASSASPDDPRLSAKEALRTVLRKSGSDSPPGPPPGTSEFSLYDSLNSDPLLNIDFIDGAKAQKSRKDSFENVTRSENKPKRVLTRSASATVVTKSALIKQASEIMDKIFMDDDGFPGEKSLTSNLKNSESKEKVSKGSRVIFSDSESVDTRLDSPKKSVKGSPSKHSHKRSRSDTSAIKMTLTRDGAAKCKNSHNGAKVLSESLPHNDDVNFGCDGFFPRPSQGQSLLQYLSSHDFHTCANLDKENAHFSISEALIAAIEQMKWNHVIAPAEPRRGSDLEEEESDEEIQQLKQRIRIRKRERLKEKTRGFICFSDGRTDTTTTTSQSRSESPLSSTHDSEYSDSAESSGIDDREIELSMDMTDTEPQTNLSSMKSSGLSLSMASLYSDADLHKNATSQDKRNSVQDSGSSYFSAESVAISLLKKFSEKQLPKASDLQWLVSEQEAPQRLLPLPNSYPVSPDDAENSQSFRNSVKAGKTRLRGNMEWAPPRAQIIFNIHPTPRRNTQLVKQNYRCTGCGMKVETGYAKRYRYCEYLGKYFCQCCHANHTTYIPGRILKRWDFTKYYVSNFARDLLARINSEPLFNVSDINPNLYKKVKLLEHIRDWRIQLRHLRSLLKVCKHATRLSFEVSKLPAHWADDANIYSLNDLVSVKSGSGGQMYGQLRSLVMESITHVVNCEFCHCLGFICEMCRDERDIIFPFQLQKVSICQGCKACFHKTCFVPQKCPKCARIAVRKQRLKEEENLSDKENEDEDR